MPEYKYKAITKDGLVVTNRVASSSKQNLITKLKNGGLTPIEITQVATASGSKVAAPTTKKNKSTDVQSIVQSVQKSQEVNGKTKGQQSWKEKLVMLTGNNVTKRDIMIFTQNFYLLKKADFNNIHALSTIIKSTENKNFQGILEDVLAGVEQGEYMYSTMEYYSNVFPYIYTNMIKVGELSGSLTQSLQQAVKYLDSNDDTSRKLKGIIIPNAFMLVAMVVLMFIGSFYTVPMIENIYKEVGSSAELPKMTIAFTNFMKWFAAHWYIFAIILVAVAGGIISYIRTPKGKYRFDYFKYTMPILGSLNYSLDFSRMVRAMLLNLQNGMRIQEALDVSKNVVNNLVMRGMVETAINNILTGQSWISPFEDAGLGSSMITEMLKVGMQTNLTEMMEKLLDYMQVEIDQKMQKVMKALPQAVYIIVGVMMIFVVIVVLVPCIQVYMGNFMFDAAGL